MVTKGVMFFDFIIKILIVKFGFSKLLGAILMKKNMNDNADVQSVIEINKSLLLS